MEDTEAKVKELESKIKEVKKRFPYHSVQSYLVQELEDLEDQLEKLIKKQDRQFIDIL